MQFERQFVDRFEITHKILMTLSLAGLPVVGAWAMSTTHPDLAVGYLGLVFVVTVLFATQLCSRCPYAHQRGDCLFFAGPIVRRVLPFRTDPMSPFGAVTLLLWVSSTFFTPLWWLMQDIGLLILFVTFGLALGVYCTFYLCRKCRNASCPCNRTGSSVKDALFDEL